MALAGEMGFAIRVKLLPMILAIVMENVLEDQIIVMEAEDGTRLLIRH